MQNQAHYVAIQHLGMRTTHGPNRNDTATAVAKWILASPRIAMAARKRKSRNNAVLNDIVQRGATSHKTTPSLLVAIQNGKTSQVLDLLHAGANPYMGLCEAITRARLNILELLLQHTTARGRKEFPKWRSIVHSWLLAEPRFSIDMDRWSMRCQTKILDVLLKYGADIESLQDGRTPLSAAVHTLTTNNFLRQSEVIRALMKRGARVDPATAIRALENAARAGDNARVQLLDTDGKVSQAVTPRAASNALALLANRKYISPGFVHFLLSKGANANAKKKMLFRILEAPPSFTHQIVLQHLLNHNVYANGTPEAMARSKRNPRYQHALLLNHLATKV